MNTTQELVRSALDAMCGPEGVDAHDVAETLIYGDDTPTLVIDCFECDDFSADTEADLLTHYAEDHEIGFESVEEVFEAYGVDINEALASVAEDDDDEDVDDDEEVGEDDEADDEEVDEDEDDEEADEDDDDEEADDDVGEDELDERSYAKISVGDAKKAAQKRKRSMPAGKRKKAAAKAARTRKRLGGRLSKEGRRRKKLSRTKRKGYRQGD